MSSDQQDLTGAKSALERLKLVIEEIEECVQGLRYPWLSANDDVSPEMVLRTLDIATNDFEFFQIILEFLEDRENSMRGWE